MDIKNFIIKICGINSLELAQRTIEMGPKYIGLNMHKNSANQLTIDQATILAANIKSKDAVPVAVFTDSDANEMLEICQKTNIDTVQLNGHISREQHYKLPPYIKRIYVIHIKDKGQVIINKEHSRHVNYLDADRDFLLFEHLPNLGTNNNIDWDDFINPFCMRFILTVNLQSYNIKSTIQFLKPYGININNVAKDLLIGTDLNRIQELIRHLNTVKEVRPES